MTCPYPTPPHSTQCPPSLQQCPSDSPFASTLPSPASPRFTSSSPPLWRRSFLSLPPVFAQSLPRPLTWSLVQFLYALPLFPSSPPFVYIFSLSPTLYSIQPQAHTYTHTYTLSPPPDDSHRVVPTIKHNTTTITTTINSPLAWLGLAPRSVVFKLSKSPIFI